MAAATIESKSEVRLTKPKDMATGQIGVIRSGCSHVGEVVQRFDLSTKKCLTGIGTNNVWDTIDHFPDDFLVEILPPGTLLKVN